MALDRPFASVLIANRGEIALRIARTCRLMGVRTIAVYSDADRDAPYARACDAAVRIGPPPARDSYLNIEAILEAAKHQRAEAIHPGYGFLAENPEFAQACLSAGIVFVGPPPPAMRAMGDKIAAKKAASAAGVNTIPGYLGDDQSPHTLRQQASILGAPLVVKAAAGGGGKGMRVIADLGSFPQALESAKREALAAFSDDKVFLERYLSAPRHIEVQILADVSGDCIYLGERECSIQRRHQKVLEESPSVAVPEKLRSEMGAAAVRVAKAVGYVNAGTAEFMLDQSGNFYFLEMNARLQVEHAVTEAVTGIDLVREQLMIAAGRPLSLRQKDVRPSGHAIEVRVYAEDPQNGFLPSVGRITELTLPEGLGIRNDAGVICGDVVSADYDPLLAKLIVLDRDRQSCVERLRAALDEYILGGVVTNIDFLRWLVRDEAFRSGETTTAFLEERFDAARSDSDIDRRLALLAAAAALQHPPVEKAGSPWRRLGGWRAACEPRHVRFSAPLHALVEVTPDGPAGVWRCRSGDLKALVECDAVRGHSITYGSSRHRFSALTSARGVRVGLQGSSYDVRLAAPPTVAASAGTGPRSELETAGSISAPMSGKIIEVQALVGEQVRAQQVLLLMSAMKMEHAVSAPYAGTIRMVHVKEGDTVGAGDPLIAIAAAQ